MAIIWWHSCVSLICYYAFFHKLVSDLAIFCTYMYMHYKTSLSLHCVVSEQGLYIPIWDIFVEFEVNEMNSSKTVRNSSFIDHISLVITLLIYI